MIKSLIDMPNIEQVVRSGLELQDPKAKADAIETIKKFYATAKNENMIVIKYLDNEIQLHYRTQGFADCLINGKWYLNISQCQLLSKISELW